MQLAPNGTGGWLTRLTVVVPSRSAALAIGQLTVVVTPEAAAFAVVVDVLVRVRGILLTDISARRNPMNI